MQSRFLFFSEIRASFKHDGTDICAVYKARRGVMLKSKRRTDACRFSRGAGGVLDSYTALSREIRTETTPCDKKVVDPLHGFPSSAGVAEEKLSVFP